VKEVCLTKGCEKESHAKGFCRKHYMRMYNKKNKEELTIYAREYWRKRRKMEREKAIQETSKKEAEKYEWLKDKNAFVMNGILLDNRMRELEKVKDLGMEEVET